MLDWDDVRIFLAVARARSLGAAAQRLCIDTATVGRRITRLETSLRSTLLVRSRSGVTLTAVGAQLMEAGLEAETAMNAALSGAQTEAKAGTVRIRRNHPGPGPGPACRPSPWPAHRTRRQCRVPVAHPARGRHGGHPDRVT
jgi:DNA-binding transcriptional LysR family regulator